MHKVDPSPVKAAASTLDSVASEPPGTSRAGNGLRFDGMPLVANRFAILGLIGVGGMASVYRARDVTLDETVALKVIARDVARAPGMLERFRREVRLARRVTHPNVARCFDIGQDHDDCFFTMELVEGESLRTRLTREGRLAPAVVVAMAIEVCAGLGAAHRVGIVHRDLKPDNVMLGTDGRVVLTDFGIASARLAEDGARRTEAVLVGTPEYISPEQIEGNHRVDARADIYALGVMLFELLTGRAPWTGPTPLSIVIARIGAQAPDPRRFIVLDENLAKITMRCMAPRREDRYENIEDVARALYAVYVPGEGEELAPAASRGTDTRGGGEDRGSPASALGWQQHDKSVVVIASSDDDDELSLAVAEGLGELIECHLRGATKVRVVPREERRSGRRRLLSGPPTTPVAIGSHARLVVKATVAVVGRSIAVDVALVNVADGVVLSARHHTCARAGLFEIAAWVAREVADKLLVGHKRTLPAGIPELDSLDLWLRARFERRAGSSEAIDRAVALFERAIGLTPDDPWVLAGYASTLVERFVETAGASSDLVEAVGMAERVLASTDLIGDAWLARGIARMELGDAPGALGDIARAGRLMPGLPRVHAIRGRLLGETRQIARARARLEGALSLEGNAADAELDIALNEALSGRLTEAQARMARVVHDTAPTPSQWLLAARVGLWSGDVAYARRLESRTASASLSHRDDCAHVAAAARGEPTNDGVDYFAWLAELDPAAARRSATAREIEAELAAANGDFARAMDAVDAAARCVGFCDEAWLEGCPLLAPLRQTPRFAEVREHVAVTARAVAEALESTREET